MTGRSRQPLHWAPLLPRAPPQRLQTHTNHQSTASQHLQAKPRLSTKRPQRKRQMPGVWGLLLRIVPRARCRLVRGMRPAHGDHMSRLIATGCNPKTTAHTGAIRHLSVCANFAHDHRDKIAKSICNGTMQTMTTISHQTIRLEHETNKRSQLYLVSGKSPRNTV